MSAEQLNTTPPDTEQTLVEFVQSEWDTGVLDTASKEARNFPGMPEGVPDITREEAVMHVLQCYGTVLRMTPPADRDYHWLFDIVDVNGEAVLALKKHTFAEWRKMFSKATELEIREMLIQKLSAVFGPGKI
jgi:hypothetical protein